MGIGEELKTFQIMKTVNLLLLSAFALSLAACGSKTGTAQSEADESSTIEEVASETGDLNPSDNTSEESAFSESEGRSANSAQIDKMLDDYEAMVAEYDKYVTNLKSGNIDMTSATNMLTKAQSMQEDLEEMESDMNSQQMQRLTKLISKLSTIAAKLSTINTNDIKSVNGVDLKSLGM